jgi:hypothetical protein
MGDQCPGRHDGMDQTAIDHLADNPPLLGHGHRTGQRQHDAAVRLLIGFQEDVERFAHLASAERGPRHATNQVGEGCDELQIDTLQRNKSIFASVVQRAGDRHG